MNTIILKPLYTPEECLSDKTCRYKLIMIAVVLESLKYQSIVGMIGDKVRDVAVLYGV